jgi:putative membrane protein insertion efficiency factor
MRKLLILLIKIYQYAISPFLNSRCRYIPTCSSYAITSIDKFGIVIGIKLTIKRILRCHPWGQQGYDPVPTYLEYHSSKSKQSCHCSRKDKNSQTLNTSNLNGK